MNDPVESIKELIEDSWDSSNALDDKLRKNKVDFVAYNQRGSIMGPVVEFHLGDHRRRETGGKDPRTEVEQEVYIVHKYPDDEDRFEMLWDMRDETERILELDRTNATDIDFYWYMAEISREWDIPVPFRPFTVGVICSFEK